MALFPEFPIIEIKEDVQLPNRTYRLDFDKGRIVGMVEGEAAIQQAIHKALYTPRFDCYAYDDQYGSEIDHLLHDPGTTREYVESELPFMLSDALTCDSRITHLSDVVCRFSGDEVYVTFGAHTTLGTMDISLRGANGSV